MPDDTAGTHGPERITIQIDRVHYEVDVTHMTGEQLRHLPQPPIGPDRDLFEVVPGHPDRKIGDSEEVELRPVLHRTRSHQPGPVGQRP
jgi:hypothetical protein